MATHCMIPIILNVHTRQNFKDKMQISDDRHWRREEWRPHTWKEIGSLEPKRLKVSLYSCVSDLLGRALPLTRTSVTGAQRRCPLELGLRPLRKGLHPAAAGTSEGVQWGWFDPGSSKTQTKTKTKTKSKTQTTDQPTNLRDQNQLHGQDEESLLRDIDRRGSSKYPLPDSTFQTFSVALCRWKVRGSHWQRVREAKPQNHKAEFGWEFRAEIQELICA